MTVTDLPFPILTIAGLGFTIFNDINDATKTAIGMTDQNAAVGITDTEFVVAERTDGKFLVAAIEPADQLCWFVPAAMVKGN